MPDPASSWDQGSLGATQVRELAARYGVRPTKRWGQHFVVDPNTVRRIVRAAEVGPEDVVVEVGPGLGSLTLALLARGCRVIAIEIDPVLAAALPGIVAEHAPAVASRLTVLQADALDTPQLPVLPTSLVSNLPYNVSVPVVLTFLERYPSLATALVMVQLEVAERIAAPPEAATTAYRASRSPGTPPRNWSGPSRAACSGRCPGSTRVWSGCADGRHR